LQEIGFDQAQSAEAPFVVDEGVDEEALLGGGGTVEFVVFGSEFGAIFGGLGEHDLRLGVDVVGGRLEKRQAATRRAEDRRVLIPDRHVG
jgi:hypothetical protein